MKQDLKQTLHSVESMMILMQPGNCSQQAIPLFDADPLIINLILGSSLVTVQEHIVGDLYAYVACRSYHSWFTVARVMAIETGETALLAERF